MILCTLLAAFSGSLGQESISIREVLAVENLGQRARSALNTDALESVLAEGTWSMPKEGDVITSTTGKERSWQRFNADENGNFSGAPFRSGWAVASVEVPAAGSWRLDLSGPSSVTVDGEPHYGDVYGLGLTRVPLYLEAGTHEFLFRTGRGSMRATLERAPSAVYLEERDITRPQVLRGEGGRRAWLGIIVCNAGAEHARGYTLRATTEGHELEPVYHPVPTLLPSSLSKSPIPIVVPENSEGDTVAVTVELVSPSGEVLFGTEVSLEVRDASGKHIRTFLSDIDGSVQYFGVTPPKQTDDKSIDPDALILTLHGAGVEGKRQAECYTQKEGAYVIAPTNRRPYGFDWEDWGRMDALEVLEIAEGFFQTDPNRTYLTGHSMGGHGTWQIGAHFPDRFAAIAPSAGWRDFWVYGGAVEADEADPLARLMLRSTNVSRTLLLKENYLHSGVYILHGDADTNVPVSEARAMRSVLAESHPNFPYYEQPGAGHWWGNQCMDWPALTKFLQANRRPADDAQVDLHFTTVNPGISSRCHWIEIQQQSQALLPSRVHAQYDKKTGEYQIDVENISRLAIDLKPFMSAPVFPAKVHIGSDALSLASYMPTYRIELQADANGSWMIVPPLNTQSMKSPERAGPFKDAFRHRMVFVYGTQGTPEENAWSLSKARFDHETWRYRGNGAVEVVADSEFDPAAYAERGVVLYGNADTNSAFEALLELKEIDLRRDFVRIGEKRVEGEDLALLAIRPRKDSAIASVAIVGGTGLVGCRTTDHRAYFVSGVGYPDWTVMDSTCLTKGLGGIRGAGFFGSDWSAGENSEAVWR